MGIGYISRFFCIMSKESKKRLPERPAECPPVPKPGETSVPHTPDLKPTQENPLVRPDATPGHQERPPELPETDKGSYQSKPENNRHIFGNRD